MFEGGQAGGSGSGGGGRTPGRALADWIVARFTVMVPFIQWLRDALGPPAGEYAADKPPIDIF